MSLENIQALRCSFMGIRLRRQDRHSLDFGRLHTSFLGFGLGHASCLTGKFCKCFRHFKPFLVETVVHLDMTNRFAIYTDG